jgi:hypothetical protein
MSEILGYKKDETPIHPCTPGMIYTACFVTCGACGNAIRSMGGPISGAVCRTCYQLDREVPDGACNSGGDC